MPLKENKENEENKSKSKTKWILWGSIGVVLLVIFAGIGLLLGVVVGCILTTEPVVFQQEIYETTDNKTYIYDAKGNTIATLTGSQNQNHGEWVSIDKVPKNLQNAFVAIEDERFFTHSGVDTKRTLSAVVSYFIPGMSGHGGSTITQQVIKNITGEDEVSIPRKVREQWRALQFEREYKKEEILEIYLNVIYLANSSYGVQDASRHYFGKDVSELSLAECAFLAGITNNPAKYNPATMRGRQNAFKRQVTILDAMLNQGMINEDQYIEAIQTELEFVKNDTTSSPQDDDGNGEVSTSSVYSYFVDMVIKDVRNALIAQGYSTKQANNLIYNTGLKIYTTQDPDVQKLVDAEYCNVKNFPVNNEDSDDPDNAQSAIVIMDQSNGHVIAIYGGYGRKLRSLSYNRAASMARQPGSSIKPPLVYAPLVDMGVITPGTVLDEEPAYMDKRNPDKIWPTDSDHIFHGLVTVRTAINRSYNMFAVMLYKNHVTDCLNYLKKAGIDRTDETHLSVALGGLTNGVSPLQMAAAYVPIANGGYYYEPVTFTRVINAKDETLIDKSAEEGTQIFSKSTTSPMMRNLLTTVVSDYRSTAPGAQITTADGEYIQTAGKTGTTTDRKDLWFVGFTPYYTCAVWYGYDNQTEITNAESSAAVKIWKAVMQSVHNNLEPKKFEMDGGKYVTRKICTVSGKLSTDACWNDARCSRLIIDEIFIAGTEPTTYCNVHAQKKVCLSHTDKYGRYYLATSKCKNTSTITRTYRNLPDYIYNVDKALLPEDWNYEFCHEYCPYCK